MAGVGLSCNKGCEVYIFLNPLKQAIAGFSEPPHLQGAPDLALAAASLGSQFGFTWEPSSAAPGAVICRLICSSNRVILGRAQVVAGPGNPKAFVPSG